MISSQQTTSPVQVNAKWQILFVAIAAAAVFTMIFSYDAKPGNSGEFLRSTDDMVRMVMVRDWLAGQSWFDPMLYRLGVAPGTTMHWSRLIDAPIGLLILFGNLFHPGSGERFAAIAWPFLTFVAALAGLLVATRRASGATNMLPALVIGGFALAMSGVFNSGVIDHHNAQLALTMWLIALLLPSASPSRDLSVVAVLVSLMLAIGMEALPLIIAAMAALLVRLTIEGDEIADAVGQLGLVLAMTTTALFIVLTGPSRYGAVYCDSFSAFHLLSAGVGGLVLFVGFWPTVRVRLQYPNFTVPMVSAIIVVTLVALLFPQCLGDPLAKLDPQLRRFWLDGVIEVQSFKQVASIDPWLLPYLVVLPVLAIISSVLIAIKGWPNSIANSLLIFIAVAFAVTAFQMRGSQFSTPIAALALSSYVTKFADGAGKDRPIALLAALVLSCMMFWKVVIVSAVSLFNNGNSGPLMSAGQKSAASDCQSDASLASLNAEPTGTIAAANNFGPVVLLETKHRVLAGPYHRNTDGNLAWINAMLANETDAKTILHKSGVTLLAICPADPDSSDFVAAEPGGFLATLLKGQSYDWLEPVASTMDKPLKLWRVVN